MSNLLSFMKNGKITLTILVDSSGSIAPKDFIIAKTCIIGLVERTLPDTSIQIINFSSNAELVSVFSTDKEQIKRNVNQKLKHLAQNTNLDIALKVALQSINTKQRDYENICVVITDGMPSDDPSSTIANMSSKGIRFFNVGVGSVTKEQLDNLFIGHNNMVFDKYDDLIEYIDQFSPNSDDFPVAYKFFPTNNKIQKTSDTFMVSCLISPSDNNEVFQPKDIEISLIPNKYYYGFNITVDKKIDFSNPCVVNMQLRATPNCGINDLPHAIEFLFKIKGKAYRGFFSLDLAWFGGDLVSNSLLNIFVDGMMGHGKSSVLNLLFNLFSSNLQISQQFLATRNTTHTTKGIEFNPIFSALQLKEEEEEFLPIYQDIIEKIKIVLVDKAGITATENNIDYSLAASGCYRPHPEKIVVDAPNPCFECHAFIFVVSMDSFSRKAEIEQIRCKILDCTNKAKIQPILVITFSDRYEHEEREEMKKDIYALPVEKDNVLFITPYINNENNRCPQKDLIGWKLIKRACEISKQTIYNKKKIQSQANLYGTQLVNNNGLNYQNNSNYQKYTYAVDNNVSPVKSPVKSSSPLTNSFNSNTPIRQYCNIVGDDTCNNDNSSPNPLKMSTSLCNPDGAANEKSKSVVMGIKYENKVCKFRVSSNSTIDDLITQVAKKFSISNFFFEDQDGCEVSGNSTLGDIVEDVSELKVTYN